MKQDKMTDEQCRLVVENLGLIHKVIRSSASGACDYEELYACGCEYLCRAAIKYDPARSTGAFTTFAYVVIRNGLIRYQQNEIRFKSRNNDYKFLKANRDLFEKVLENITISNVYSRLIGNARHIPLKRGIKFIFENAINGTSIGELAEKYGVSRNTVYTNMSLARRYLKNTPFKEKIMLMENEHRSKREDDQNES